MRTIFRTFIFGIVAALLALPLSAETTPAEARANAAAQHEMDSSPRNGNLPSYSLLPEQLEVMRHLYAIRVPVHFATELLQPIIFLLLLTTGLARRYREWAVRAFNSHWPQGFTFWGLVLASMTLIELPIDIYAQHLRRVYGMSVQGWGGWLQDFALNVLLTWGIGGMVVMLIFLCITKFPRRWWLVFWLATIPMLLIGIFAKPYVIDPLFDKFEPLAKTNPVLVTQLQQVAQRGGLNIPADRMFLMKASAKTTTLNAYVTGFGSSKRVVVWDTSIAQGTTDQLLFIFGHESGHYVLQHIVRGTVIAVALFFVAFLIGQYCVVTLIRRFGPRWGIASLDQWSSLVVMLLVVSILSIVAEPVQSAISRQQEHAADVYGMEAIHGLVSDPKEATRSSFELLGRATYDNPNPSQLLEFWTYDHPATGRRAAFAAHYDPWAAGALPKYLKQQ